MAGVLQSARRFIIPEYQRPYCWTGEQVEQLWGDLQEAYGECVASVPARQVEDCFLGPLVVATRKDSDTGAVLADVVDGQQRLTTVHCLLWCIRHRLQSEQTDAAVALRTELERYLLTPAGKATLAVAREDQANFMTIQKMGTLDETRGLGTTAALLRAKIDGWTDCDGLIAFGHYVLNHATFVLVQCSSCANAWELFIALNSKGKPLEPADLIKAYACGTGADSEAVAGMWQDKMLPLGSYATSATMEVSRMATGIPGTDAKLFKTFQGAWSARTITPALLGSGAEAYRRYRLDSEDALVDLGRGRRSLRGIRELKRRDHTSVMIAIATKYSLPAMLRDDLLAAFEAYQFWMAIRGRRGRERDFTALAHKIHTGSLSLDAALAELASKLAQLAPARGEVQTAVRNAAYRGRVMLFIVRSYEEGMRGDIRIDDVQYEHMMPQAPTAYWHAAAGTTDPNAYSSIINNIGNIVCLDSNTNIVGRNEPWDVKRKLYQDNVPNWLAADLARKHAEWTSATITRRANAIADWAVDVRWDLFAAIENLRKRTWKLKDKIVDDTWNVQGVAGARGAGIPRPPRRGA